MKIRPTILVTTHTGNEVLDSVAISAHLGSAAITGYSSFVNITRKREVDLTFLSTEGELVYASLVFDVPTWDIDNLRIWQQSILGEKILVKMNTEAAESQQKMKTIMRLECLVSDVVGYVWDKHAPSQPFADLATALSLQNLLNAIERDAKTLGPVQYVISKREFVNNEVDLERLG